MTATIPEPQHLWGRDFDEVLGDNPDGALDRIVRRLLVQVDDITIGEVDRITARAVAAGKAAILETIGEVAPPVSALTDDQTPEPGE